jgi:hypothetical protein
MSFNDNFAGASLLIVFDEETTTGMILRRKLEGKALSFKQTQIEGEKGMFLIDDETGSIWEGLSGRAVRGRSKARSLSPYRLLRLSGLVGSITIPTPNFLRCRDKLI